MCVIVFVSATIFNVQISPTFCERMYVCACVGACVRAVCFVFKYFSFLGSFFVLCCMHSGLGLSVRLSVCPFVCLSVCLHAHPQFGRQKDRQLHRQREKSIVQQWLVRVRKLQLFFSFLSFFLCMHAICLSVCLPAWMYTHMIVRMKACAHTYQPPDRKSDCQTDRLTDRLADRPHPHVLWERTG